MNEPEKSTENSDDAPPLSLARLTAAFSKMLQPARAREVDAQQSNLMADADAGVTVRGVVEAMLFVADEQNAPLAAQQIADTIRDVSPAEVVEAIDQLNSNYENDEAPYRIQHSPGGYRLRLHEGLERLSDRMHGRIRSARLSSHALEALSVVAYRQPISAEEIDALRGKESSGAIAQLVRRGLVQCIEVSQNSEGAAGGPHYQTTDRFLRVFGLSDSNQLPRVAELED